MVSGAALRAHLAGLGSSGRAFPPAGSGTPAPAQEKGQGVRMVPYLPESAARTRTDATVLAAAPDHRRGRRRAGPETPAPPLQTGRLHPPPRPRGARARWPSLDTSAAAQTVFTLTRESSYTHRLLCNFHVSLFLIIFRIFKI